MKATSSGLIITRLVSILLPLAIVLFGVRLLLTPAFIQIEYRTPGFPTDPYGFTFTDRLYWAEIAREYLLNDADISFLGDVKFSDGSPVYNLRELAHMVDVKNAIKITLRVWHLSLAGLFIFAIWAWQSQQWRNYLVGLVQGGWITIIMVGVILLFVVAGFGVFLISFHQVFFAPGTWMFDYSDTLIRLFPERFWRDTFLVVGILSIVCGLGFALGFKKKSLL